MFSREPARETWPAFFYGKIIVPTKMTSRCGRGQIWSNVISYSIAQNAVKVKGAEW